MSFEYNGVVYRDLEPQVRYDAEQVQLLKQADVTINESLQTINTEINGKLTKPTNPSAESAVTLLADGTVGTKPLSEIGGGGGKLYRHEVEVDYNDYMSVLFMVFYTQNSTLINTLDKINNNSSTKYINCVYSGPNGEGSVIMLLNKSTFSVHGVITYREGGTDTTVNVYTENVTPVQITDVATEL